MKNWLQKMMDRFARFMYGRYGTDELTLAMLVGSMVLTLLSALPFMDILSLASTVVLVLGLYRCFSKNIEKRRSEYFAYMRLKQRLVSEAKLWKMRWQGRKECHYFKCKHCKTVYRVPRGRGKIEATCPKCHNKEIRHS